MLSTDATSDILDVVKNVVINLLLQSLLKIMIIVPWISNIQVQVTISNMAVT
jgi:hypothetical protein